ncbi:MAG: CBS domain-containing protein [Chloroflexi bacterium]|nr:MAG: CBS domain-containing protein [Chloroflexota bacterium]
MTEVIQLTRKDFVSDQTVRWCPGCGDYAILAQIQKVLPELGRPKEDFVFISGIGCSSRFPYYMDTYGIHSIHGRAPTLATGLKIANPNLSVWVITGDGDGLSIGGNHFVHVLRRNVDLNIILFNNRIYGLTKGQYSPTSEQGKITKSSPMGSLEQPLNPISVAIGAEATFVARTVDTNVKHMAEMLRRAAAHKGTSIVEVYQNCVIFNNGAYSYATDSKTKSENVLELEHGKPMIFGKNRDKGIRLNGLNPEVVSLDAVDESELLVHDETMPEPSLAYMLSRMRQPAFPEPIGVFRDVQKPVYEEGVMAQVKQAKAQKGEGDLAKMYGNADTWEVVSSEFDDEYTSVLFHGENTADRDVAHALLTDTLADLSPKKPLTAHVDISLADAVARLKEVNVGFLALVDDDGNLAGVFTEWDIFTKVACKIKDMSQERVKDYMTPNVTTLGRSDTIAHALHLMAINHFRHIPIVNEDGKPEGVISFRSVVHFLEENFAPGKTNGKS